MASVICIPIQSIILISGYVILIGGGILYVMISAERERGVCGSNNDLCMYAYVTMV